MIDPVEWIDYSELTEEDILQALAKAIVNNNRQPICDVLSRLLPEAEEERLIWRDGKYVFQMTPKHIAELKI